MHKIGRVLSVITFVVLASLPAYAQKSKAGNVNASGNFTVGLGPIGNFYITHRHPDLSPGIGALVYFDYRWSPELSTTATVMMLVQNGTGLDTGENTVVFMGIPTFDIKYYFITNPSRWDPFIAAGLGYYVSTTGSKGRGTASGLGAEVGTGFDFYLTSKVSLGFASYFRSAALLGGGATGTFPLSFLGNFGFHF